MKLRLSIVLIFFILISFVPFNASAITYPDDIVDHNSDSFTVALYYNPTPGIYFVEQPNPICSGVVYLQQVIITAAHCVEGLSHENILVGVPGSKVSEAYVYQAVGVITHERYSRSRTTHGVNDLALIVLDSSIPGTVPVIIPDSNQSKKLEKNNMFIFGYGIDQNAQSPDEARYSSVKNFNDIAKKYNRYFNPNIHIAVGKYNKKERVYSGACFGDSGGPLIAYSGNKPYLLGVSSFVHTYANSKSCNSKLPSVYMKISSYKPWIEKNLNRLGELSYNGSYKFKVLDRIYDAVGSDGSNVGGDIYSVIGETSGKDQTLIVYIDFSRAYADTEIASGIYFDFNEDGEFDWSESNDGDFLVDNSGNFVCDFTKYTEKIKVTWLIGEACFSKAPGNWFDLSISTLEYFDHPSIFFESLDDIYLTGLYISSRD
jgi:hypothetical protein